MPDGIGTATHMDRLGRMVIQGNQNTSGGAKKRGGVLYYPSTRHFSLPTRNDRGMISYMNSRNGHPQLSSSHHVGSNHRVCVVVVAIQTSDWQLNRDTMWGRGASRVCKVCARPPVHQHLVVVSGRGLLSSPSSSPGRFPALARSVATLVGGLHVNGWLLRCRRHDSRHLHRTENRHSIRHHHPCPSLVSGCFHAAWGTIPAEVFS